MNAMLAISIGLDLLQSLPLGVLSTVSFPELKFWPLLAELIQEFIKDAIVTVLLLLMF